MIPLSVPNLNGNEWQYVKECLDTGWISTAGQYVEEFESKFASYVGTPSAVSTVNGTAALHTGLHILGVKPGDLVVVPNITFVASANSISYLGASPLLVDIDSETWQIDIDLLEQFFEMDCSLERGTLYQSRSKRRIAALMVVHLQGNICNMDRLTSLCQKFCVPVIEDAAEALGSRYKDRFAGTIGRIGAYSFNGNKIISTGGGGMLVSASEALSARAKHLTTTAKTDPMTYFHDDVGYNYRLVNVLAAIGVAQLEQLDLFVQRKREIADVYRANLQGVGDISFQKIETDVFSNEWLFTLMTDRSQELMNYLIQRKIMVRPFWVPMNMLPMYSSCTFVNMANISREVHQRSISIPCSTSLSEIDQEYVIDSIKSFFSAP